MIQTLNEGVSTFEKVVFTVLVPHATMEIWPAKYCFTNPTLSTVIFPTVNKQMRRVVTKDETS